MLAYLSSLLSPEWGWVPRERTVMPKPAGKSWPLADALQLHGGLISVLRTSAAQPVGSVVVPTPRNGVDHPATWGLEERETGRLRAQTSVRPSAHKMSLQGMLRPCCCSLESLVNSLMGGIYKLGNSLFPKYGSF